MTNFDLQLLFEDEIGPLMTDSMKVFKTSEIDRFLNTAMDKYFRELAKIFEVDEEARRALSGLVKQGSLSAAATPAGITPLDTNSVFYTLPSVYDRTLYKIVEEYVTDGSGNRILAKPVTHDQYLINITNPFKKPYADMVWRVDVSNAVEIIPVGVVPVLYVFRYLTSPTAINITSGDSTPLDLPEKDLKNIVSLAVQLALNSLSVVKPRET